MTRSPEYLVNLPGIRVLFPDAPHIAQIETDLSEADVLPVLIVLPDADQRMVLARRERPQIPLCEPQAVPRRPEGPQIQPVLVAL